jgi:hypothetical protein
MMKAKVYHHAKVPASPRLERSLYTLSKPRATGWRRPIKMRTRTTRKRREIRAGTVIDMHSGDDDPCTTTDNRWEVECGCG